MRGNIELWLMIIDNDNLPTKICVKCINRLNIAFDFTQLAYGSQKALKQFLKKVSNEFEEVTRLNPKIAEALDDSALIMVSDDDIEDCVAILNEREDEDPDEISAVTPSTSISKSLNLGTNIDKSKSVLITIKEEPKTVSTEQTLKREYEVDDDEIEYQIQNAGLNEHFEVDNSNVKEIGIDDTTHLRISKVHRTDKFNIDDTERVLELLDDTSENENIETDAEAIPVDGDGYLKEYEEILDDSENKDDYMDMEDMNDMILDVEYLNSSSIELRPSKVNNSTSVMGTELGREPHPVKLRTNINTTPQKNSNNFKLRRTRIRTDQLSGRNSNESSNKIRYYCEQCNTDYTTKTNLNRHMATHDGKKPYACNICGKGFTQNGSLKHHMYTHTGEKPYVCEVCNRGFTQSKSLVFHKRRHSGDKPFACVHCGTSFRQKDGLKVHILRHHTIVMDDGEIETHMCSICKEDMYTKENLQLHMKKHVNNHKIKDSQCQATGSTGSDETFLELLDEEMLLNDSAENEMLDNDGTHVINVSATSATQPFRAKKYQCCMCFKCFAIKENLMRHLTIHSVESLYECKYCSIYFESQQLLGKHITQTHEGFSQIREYSQQLANVRNQSTIEYQKMRDENKVAKNII
ncbi:zinc finger protein 350-like isoform X2 [Teleopsis dalmanni]|uniref:zinc finger protein 350-like isoform X2 n=1 Tax=Teleopsis dalmanni TaxID=139649 RepID=UPI0018CD54EC|nr:zinc finger protein 350-like isoform X2 [Teleopsis dalmanni]